MQIVDTLTCFQYPYVETNDKNFHINIKRVKNRHK